MLEELSVQIVGFVILFLVLRKVAWKPMLALLDERRRSIEGGFNEIAKGKAELERLQRELHARLTKIDEEARLKIQQAILEGKRISVEIQQKAREDAQADLQKSKETIELAVAQAKVSLRDDLVDMTVEAVERLLRQKFDAKTDEALIASILDELAEPAKRQAAGAGSH
ncbi:MAG: F0F1 ATP synthase subunit B [Candidatus Omnitrophica bacterium]|nr:F0F1 ATP synthase subunit B [Candidatus Omnitrophota bacterium]